MMKSVFEYFFGDENTQSNLMSKAQKTGFSVSKILNIVIIKILNVFTIGVTSIISLCEFFEFLIGPTLLRECLKVAFCCKYISCKCEDEITAIVDSKNICKECQYMSIPFVLPRRHMSATSC